MLTPDRQHKVYGCEWDIDPSETFALDWFVFVRFYDMIDPVLDLLMLVCPGGMDTSAPLESRHYKDGREGMMLTHPPVDRIRCNWSDVRVSRTLAPKHTARGPNGAALTLGSLFDVAGSSGEDDHTRFNQRGLVRDWVFDGPTQVCALWQGINWAEIRGTVDSIRGHEMLDIFSMPHDDREDVVKHADELREDCLAYWKEHRDDKAVWPC